MIDGSFLIILNLIYMAVKMIYSGESIKVLVAGNVGGKLFTWANFMVGV